MDHGFVLPTSHNPWKTLFQRTRFSLGPSRPIGSCGWLNPRFVLPASSYPWQQSQTSDKLIFSSIMFFWPFRVRAYEQTLFVFVRPSFQSRENLSKFFVILSRSMNQIWLRNEFCLLFKLRSSNDLWNRCLDTLHKSFRVSFWSSMENRFILNDLVSSILLHVTSTIRFFLKNWSPRRILSLNNSSNDLISSVV